MKYTRGQIVLSVLLSAPVFALCSSGQTTHDSPPWRQVAPTQGMTSQWCVAPTPTGVMMGGYDGSVSFSDDGGATWRRVRAGVDSLSVVYGLSYGNGRFVATGMRNNMPFAAASEDNLDWERQTPPVQGGTVRAIVYDGTRFVALGGGYYCLTSLDGISWTRSYIDSNGYHDLCRGAGRYVAVGSSGGITTSENAASWTSVSSGTSATLLGVCYGEKGFVAVGEEGAIVRSIDGVEWSSTSRTTLGRLWSVAYGNGRFVAVGGYLSYAASVAVTLVSEDGIRWRRTSNPSPQTLHDVTFSQGSFVAVGDFGSVIASEDGETWISRKPADSQDLSGVAYGNNIFVSVGLDGVIRNSKDGLNWETTRTGQSEYLYSAAYGAGVFVAGAADGGIYTSPNAATWERHATGEGMIKCIRYLEGQFFALSETGVLLRSSDATSWSKVPSLDGTPLQDITRSQIGYVAVGFDGVVVTSTDGAVWNRHAAPSLQNLLGIAFGSGRYVAVGDGGTIITSLDGIDWSPATSGISYELMSVASANGMFVATGYSGTILYSTNGLEWTSTYSGTNTALNRVQFLNGEFVASGVGFVSHSPDGVSWSPLSTRSQLDITYGGGVYLEVGIARLNSSVDLDYWTPQSLGSTTSHWLADVAFADGTFVACGSKGNILTSTDGRDWTVHYADGYTGSLRGVGYGAGRYVVVGENGIILHSADANNWSATRVTGVSVWHDLAFAEGKFVAVGWPGGIATSPDGMVWTRQNLNSDAQLISIAFGNDRFVAASSEGDIFTSFDGVEWGEPQVIEPWLKSVVFADGEFVASGSASGKTFHSFDGQLWTASESDVLHGYDDMIEHDGAILAVGSSGVISVYAVPPKWTTQPSSRIVPIGQPTTLSSEASGPGPLRFQWYKNGVLVPDATSATLSWPSFSVDDAGAYQVRVTGLGGTSDSNIAVLKAQAFVTLSELSGVYDGGTHSVSTTTSPGGLNVTVTYDGSLTPPTNAGSYTVFAQIDDSTYGGSKSGTLTIDKASPTIVWAAPQAIIYGTALSHVQLNAASNIPGTFQYLPASGTILDAGSNQVLSAQFTPSDASNYNAASLSESIDVGKAPLVARGDDKLRVFGDPNPALTVSYTGFVNGDTQTALASPPATSTVATSSSHPGSYPIDVSGGAAANYTIIPQSGVLTVTKASAAVAIANAQQTYNGKGHAVSTSTSPSGLNVIVTYDGNPTPPTNAGSYVVVAQIDDMDYAGIASSVLVVGKATPIVTWSTPAAIDYGAPLSTSELNARANMAGSFEYTPAGGSKLNAGANQVLTTVFTPLDTTNFSTANAVTTIDVAKAPLTARAENKSRPYGATNPALTVSYSGFVYNETEAVLTSAVTATTAATASSHPGTYSIDVSGGAAANYTIVPQSGVLTITKGSASIAIAKTRQTYDGAGHAVSTSTSPSGLKVVITYDGGATLPTNAGSYAVGAQIDDVDYAGSASSELVIAKATPTVSWETPAAIAYGTALSPTELDATGNVAGSFEYIPASGSMLNAGSGQVLTTTFTPSDTVNYTTATADTTLEVTKVPLTAKAEDKTRLYGTPNPAFTVTYSGFVNNETEAVLTSSATASTAATASSPPGTYSIDISGGAAKNYSIIGQSGLLTVTEASATIAIANTQQVYDGDAKAVSVTTNPAGLPVTITYNGSPTPPTNAGSYAVVAHIDDANYTGSVNGTMVVAEASPAVTWATPEAIRYGVALSSSQLNATADVAGSFSYTPASGTILNAGSNQNLAVVFTPSDTANYTATNAGASIDVVKAELTARADDVSRVFGGANPPLTVRYSGFVNNDTEDVLTSPAVATTAATAESAPGSYPITVSGGSAGNYTVVGESGVLTVTKVDATITVSNTEHGYDGTPKSVSVATDPADLAVTITYDGSDEAPVKTGSYDVIATIDDANYTGSATATLVIKQTCFAGAYFGTLAPGGTWAMHINPDNTGKFIAYLPATNIAIVLDVVIGPNGSCLINGAPISVASTTAEGVAKSASNSIETQAMVDSITLSVNIANGCVSGDIAELGAALTGTVDPSTGPALTIAGLYSASALNVASGTLHAVVGASGQAMIVVEMPGLVDGGMGWIDTDGELSMMLEESTSLVADIDGSSGDIAGSITPPGTSTPVLMTGLSAATMPVNRIVNLSTRGFVGKNDNVMIVGFVIAGSGSKQILIRAVGPTLGLPPFGVSGTITDPQITLVRQSDGLAFAANDNWSDDGGAALLNDAFAQTGAFSIPENSRDAALTADLPAGAYTAIVSGVGATSGVAIAELYTMADASTPTARLVNISTRGYVGTGDSIMIPGFVTDGNAPRRLLIRGIGPTLSQAPFNVGGVLADPVLSVYVEGMSSPVATNDDWDANGTGDALADLAQQVTGFLLPRGSKDAALVITIPPNTSYTVLVSGKNGATGVVLAEVYELP